MSIIDLQASANVNGSVYAKDNATFSGNNANATAYASNLVNNFNNTNSVKEIVGVAASGESVSASNGLANGVVTGSMEGPVLVRKARVRTVSRRELARHQQHHHQGVGKGLGGGGGGDSGGGGGGTAAEYGVLALDAAEKVPSAINGWRHGKVQNNPTTP